MIVQLPWGSAHDTCMCRFSFQIIWFLNCTLQLLLLKKHISLLRNSYFNREKRFSQARQRLRLDEKSFYIPKPLLLSQMDEIAKLDSILNRRGSLLLLQNEWSVDYLIRGLLDQNQFNALALRLPSCVEENKTTSSLTRALVTTKKRGERLEIACFIGTSYVIRLEKSICDKASPQTPMAIPLFLAFIRSSNH